METTVNSIYTSHVATTKVKQSLSLFEAYLDDLNDVKDGDKEVIWDLAPVWNGTFAPFSAVKT